MCQLLPLQVRGCGTCCSSFLYRWLRLLRIRIPLLIERFLRLLILWNTRRLVVGMVCIDHLLVGTQLLVLAVGQHLVELVQEDWVGLDPLVSLVLVMRQSSTSIGAIPNEIANGGAILQIRLLPQIRLFLIGNVVILAVEACDTLGHPRYGDLAA